MKRSQTVIYTPGERYRAIPRSERYVYYRGKEGGLGRNGRSYAAGEIRKVGARESVGLNLLAARAGRN